MGRVRLSRGKGNTQFTAISVAWGDEDQEIGGQAGDPLADSTWRGETFCICTSPEEAAGFSSHFWLPVASVSGSV